jgi:hypothetical protein
MIRLDSARLTREATSGPLMKVFLGVTMDSDVRFGKPWPAVRQAP